MRNRKNSMTTPTYDLEEAIDASHTVVEFAECLGIHPQTVYKRAKKDERYQDAIERIGAKDFHSMKVVGLRLPDSLIAWLKWQAKQDESSVSGVVRDWLDKHPGYAEYVSNFD